MNNHSALGTTGIFAILLVIVVTQIKAEEIPVYLLEVGSNSGDFAIIVDKKNQELHLYKGSLQGPQLQKKYRCTTGKNNNGTKRREGDNKTPNGVYFFKSILEDEQLPAKYGVRAFPMDYPNDYDRLYGKTGHGIWLHAVDEENRVEISHDTEGCVVVTNSDIIELSDYIKLRSTPIIVDDSLLTGPSESVNEKREEILGFVNNWIDAWQDKDIDRYMDCYDRRFNSYGRTWEQHRAYKQQLNKNYKKIEVNLSGIKISGYSDYYVVSFLQEYRSDLFHSKGPKKLYLQRTKDGLKIITERMNR